MLPARSRFAFVSCLLLSACGGATIPISTETANELLNASIDITSGPAATADTGANDINFADLLNGLRASRGLDGVSYDARLDQAAQKHAQDMVDRGYFSHTTEGSGFSPLERIRAEGYDPSGYAENIAQGQQTQGEALVGWINSPDHNAALSAPLEEFAIGAAGSGSELTWVLLLATER